MKPLAVQLYSLRDPNLKWEWTPQLLPAELERVAGFGFLGVETVDVPGGDPVAARRVLDGLGLKVTSSHTWADLADQEAFSKACDAIAEFGSTRVMSFGGGFNTVADVEAAADRLNRGAADARRAGLQLALHNEVSEAKVIEGTRVYERLRDLLDPDVRFQVDIFWSSAGGVPPAEMIGNLGDRVVSLHVKDAPEIPDSTSDVFEHEFFNVAVGDGVVDVAGAIAAANVLPSIEWLIVEFDYCATDVFEGVAKSYRYLVEHGLGRGSR